MHAVPRIGQSACAVRTLRVLFGTKFLESRMDTACPWAIGSWRCVSQCQVGELAAA